ncbi:MAG: hypothetical protein LUG51_08400 [Tannerellaceae bacterium]|nr:hypothetical protein [Tannerellaceae bacterium]
MPECISDWGWQFHHIGIPTHEQKPGEWHIPHLKIHVAGFPQSPFGIEWMRFDPGCGISELTQTVPHIAFVVPDLDWELANRNLNILSSPSSPSGGVRVAMIEYNGAPVELMEFEKVQ